MGLIALWTSSTANFGNVGTALAIVDLPYIFKRIENADRTGFRTLPFGEPEPGWDLRRQTPIGRVLEWIVGRFGRKCETNTVLAVVDAQIAFSADAISPRALICHSNSG